MRIPPRFKNVVQSSEKAYQGRKHSEKFKDDRADNGGSTL